MNRAQHLILLVEEAVGAEASLYHTFDIHDIDNKRFMYNPKTNEMILGASNMISIKKPVKRGEWSDLEMVGITKSHAEEHDEVGARGHYDDFVKGWVGTSKKYPHGVIHFAPPVSSEMLKDPDVADYTFKTLEKFLKNGANQNTVLRNVGFSGERKLKDAYPKLVR